jgi:hypothetical protein
MPVMPLTHNESLPQAFLLATDRLDTPVHNNGEWRWRPSGNRLDQISDISGKSSTA